MLLPVGSWQSQHLSVKTQKIKKLPLEKVSDQTIPILRWPLTIPSLVRSDLWSYSPQTEETSDHTILRPKWLLFIQSPDRSDLWSYHPQTEVASDHTIVRSNQIPDPVNLVWEHTVCVGLGLIRVHFQMAPQPGAFVLFLISGFTKHAASYFNLLLQYRKIHQFLVFFWNLETLNSKIIVLYCSGNAFPCPWILK